MLTIENEVSVIISPVAFTPVRSVAVDNILLNCDKNHPSAYFRVLNLASVLGYLQLFRQCQFPGMA